VGYLGYYFAWLALSYLIRQPWLLVGLVALWLVRGFLPSPGALFGALGRAGRLREQVRVNRANITARRDLATIYLSLLRPRRALPLLEEGLSLSPDDAELLYLHGVALHRAGRYEAALARLLAAIEKDQRLRHGHPYFVAGETLLALQRWDDAVDAFERFLDFNSSDVAAFTMLARAYAGGGNAEAARKWLLSGRQAWHGLPGAMKRRQFGAYLKAQWARVSVLKEPGAIVITLGLVALCGLGARAALPGFVQLWKDDPHEQAEAALDRGFMLCGTQQTGDFAGNYEALSSGPQRKQLDDRAREEMANFTIESDRIHFGTQLVAEFCLTKVIERTPKLLRAQAVWHEDRGDPGDASMVELRLTRADAFTRFSYTSLFDDPDPLRPEIIDLRRLP
jgi:tetratricopeptide (TPR) repeat protein